MTDNQKPDFGQTVPVRSDADKVPDRRMISVAEFDAVVAHHQQFEREDGKMSDAEHNHVLVKAFADHGLALEARESGYYFLEHIGFHNRTAAWRWLHDQDKLIQQTERVAELESQNDSLTQHVKHLRDTRDARDRPLADVVRSVASDSRLHLRLHDLLSAEEIVEALRGKLLDWLSALQLRDESREIWKERALTAEQTIAELQVHNRHLTRAMKSAGLEAFLPPCDPDDVGARLENVVRAYDVRIAELERSVAEDADKIDKLKGKIRDLVDMPDAIQVTAPVSGVKSAGESESSVSAVNE